MPVPNSITELDTAAANNSPQGSETAKGNIDNYLRAGFAFIRQLFDTTWKPGMIAYTAASTPDTGWLAADGSVVSRTTYAALFNRIGTTYGAGDGVTTFKLPDLRGEFVRGLDSGRGVDTGRTLGSSQSDDVKPHNHTATTNSQGSHSHGGTTSGVGDHAHPLDGQTIQGSLNYSPSALTDTGARGLGTGTGPAGAHSHTIATDGAHTHTVTVNNSSGTETRPRNVALLAIIKT